MLQSGFHCLVSISISIVAHSSELIYHDYSFNHSDQSKIVDQLAYLLHSDSWCLFVKVLWFHCFVRKLQLLTLSWPKYAPDAHLIQYLLLLTPHASEVRLYLSPSSRWEIKGHRGPNRPKGAHTNSDSMMRARAVDHVAQCSCHHSLACLID